MIGDLFLGLALTGQGAILGWFVGGVALSDAGVDNKRAQAFARVGSRIGAVLGCTLAAWVLS